VLYRVNLKIAQTFFENIKDQEVNTDETLGRVAEVINQLAAND